MDEDVKRLHPKEADRRRLFLLSRNLCAFPGCTREIVDPATGRLRGEVCHIEGANPGSARFNRKQTNEQRRAYGNLILLCRTDHVVTDDESKFSPTDMWKMKEDHEHHAGVAPDCQLVENFLDHSVIDYALPKNLKQLDLDLCEEQFFVDANLLLQAVAKLPQRARSLFAHAVAYAAYSNSLSLRVDLVELSDRLRASRKDLEEQFSILERANLVAIWEAGELPWGRHGRAYYLRGIDSEDNGIWLLELMRRRFASDTLALVDVIENLNFSLLEGDVRSS